MCIKVTIVPDSQVSQFEEGLKTLPENVTRDDEELVEALCILYDGLRADQKSQIPEESVKKLQDRIFRRYRTSVLFSAGQRPHGFWTNEHALLKNTFA